MSWVTCLIKNVAVELSWDPAFDETNCNGVRHGELRGELEDFLFCDRQAVIFSRGPDGTGFLSVIKNAHDAIKSLQASILRLQHLERFVWQTAILPMPSSVCLHL